MKLITGFFLVENHQSPFIEKGFKRMNKLLLSGLLALSATANAFTISLPPVPQPPPPPPKPAPKISYQSQYGQVQTTDFKSSKLPKAKIVLQNEAEINAVRRDFATRFGLGKTKSCKYTPAQLKAKFDGKAFTSIGDNLSYCVLKGFNLKGVKLLKTTAHFTNFDNAVLGYARQMTSWGASFYGTDLRGVDLSWSYLAFPLLQNAAMDGSIWGHAKLFGYMILKSSGRLKLDTASLKMGFVTDTRLINGQCGDNPPKLALCDGSSAKSATIDRLVVRGSNITGLDVSGASLAYMTVISSEVTGFDANTAVSSRNTIIRESFEHVILLYKGKPVAKTTRDRGWSGDEVVNFGN